MSLRVDAYVEPTCPYSYMLYRSLLTLAAESDLEPRWHMVALTARRARGSRAAAADAAMREAAHRATWPAIQALAARDYGLRLGQPGCATDPRPACVAALHVRRTAPEQLTGFLGRLFETHFGRDIDAEPEAAAIDDPAVLARLVNESGASAASLAADLKPARRDALLGEDRAAADREGLSAVPALRLGDHLLLGAQPPSVLRGALAGLKAQAAVARISMPDTREVSDG